MEFILEIAKLSSPWVAIVLALVVILQLVGGKKIMLRIRGTQETKYPELQHFMKSLEAVQTQNERLLENHFKHEIPDLINTVARIEEKVDVIKDDHGNRLTRLETIVEVAK